MRRIDRNRDCGKVAGLSESGSAVAKETHRRSVQGFKSLAAKKVTRISGNGRSQRVRQPVTTPLLSEYCANFYNARWIYLTLSYRTPDEVHFGTCNRQAQKYSISKAFIPSFPQKVAQSAGRAYKEEQSIESDIRNSLIKSRIL